MKKWLAVLLWLACATPLWAQERVKIGFIDMQRAMNESETGRRAREKLQVEFKKAEADLLKEEEELKRLRSDIDKKGTLLREEERKNLEKEFQRRYVGFQRSVRDQQEEFRQKESEMASQVLQQVRNIIAEVGKSDKFTLILEKSQVLYSDQATDITAKVIDLYNSRGGGKATKGK